MSESSSGAGSCCLGDWRNLAIVALSILLTIATTGWVVTVTQQRPIPVDSPAAAPVKSEPVLPPLPVAAFPSETVEVLVAVKDIPVGTVFTKSDAPLWVKKKIAKEKLPSAFVNDAEELIDRRLTRTVHPGETFHPNDLARQSGPTLPEGMNWVSLPFDASHGAGFIGPGNKVDVIATIRLGKKLHAFQVAVNLLVVAMDSHNPANEPATITVSFAVTDKQALVLSLAKQRGCQLELLLRHPNKEDKEYDLDKVLKLLSDEPIGDNLIPRATETPLDIAPAPPPVGR